MKRYLFDPVVMALPIRPFFYGKSCSKNLDEILRVVKNADLSLDLGTAFVAWVGKDRQLTNSAVLRGRQHFFVHQVFETDRRRYVRPFLECVTTGSCVICLFTTHDASDGRYKKGKERVRFFLVF